MKIIIDGSSINVTDTVDEHPNRLFFCSGCNLISTRRQVRKDADGIYHCPSCTAEVPDITDTTHGRIVLAFLGKGE